MKNKLDYSQGEISEAIKRGFLHIHYQNVQLFAIQMVNNDIVIFTNHLPNDKHEFNSMFTVFLNPITKEADTNENTDNSYAVAEMVRYLLLSGGISKYGKLKINKLPDNAIN